MKVLFNPPFLIVKASQLGCQGNECYTHDKGRGLYRGSSSQSTLRQDSMSSEERESERKPETFHCRMF